MSEKTIREIIVGLFVAVVGGIMVVVYTREGAPFGPTPAPTQIEFTLFTPTPNYPYVSLENRLILPVKVYIANQYRNTVNSRDTAVFLVESFPAQIEFEVVSQSNGVDYIRGIFSGVENGRRLIVTNVVGETQFFFVVLDNMTPKQCEISINDGLVGEQKPGTLLPNAQNVGVGYYRLYSNSNVTLFCDDGYVHWWGIRPVEQATQLPLMQFVQSETGILEIRLESPDSNPPTAPSGNVSVEQAIRDYFSLVEQQQYEEAYAMLSDNFKSSKVPTLQAYVTEWEKSGPAMFDEPIIATEQGDFATAMLMLHFPRSTGQASYIIRYYLIRIQGCSNPRFGCWQITSGEVVTEQ